MKTLRDPTPRRIAALSRRCPLLTDAEQDRILEHLCDGAADAAWRALDACRGRPDAVVDLGSLLVCAEVLNFFRPEDCANVLARARRRLVTATRHERFRYLSCAAFVAKRRGRFAVAATLSRRAAHLARRANWRRSSQNSRLELAFVLWDASQYAAAFATFQRLLRETRSTRQVDADNLVTFARATMGVAYELMRRGKLKLAQSRLKAAALRVSKRVAHPAVRASRAMLLQYIALLWIGVGVCAVRRGDAMAAHDAYRVARRSAIRPRAGAMPDLTGRTVAEELVDLRIELDAFDRATTTARTAV